MARKMRTGITLALMALALSACMKSETASRGHPPPADATLAVVAMNGTAPGLPASPAAQGPVVLAPAYTVTGVTVSVPSSLRVSEANTFYPMADIVWRGEPRGNRHQQVQAIFTEAAATATQGMSRGMSQGPEVVVDLAVTRFHSVTEKTRYTVGGTHSLHFDLTVRDAATGRVIDGPRAIVADVKAAGGAQAVAEEQAGRTQRVVILERLAQVLRRELSRPVGGAATGPGPLDVSMMNNNLLLTATGLGL